MTEPEQSPATASYVVQRWDANRQPTRLMWSCDACGEAALVTGEAACIRDMNGHMAEVHPDSGYTPAAEL